MQIFTIGSTQSTAAQFFGRLRRAGARKIIDVRLNNRSRLAGFAKREDLKFFAAPLCGMDYEHLPEFAPTQAMLGDYRKGRDLSAVYSKKNRRIDCRPGHRDSRAGAVERGVPSVQRGAAASLSPPFACRIPRRTLAGGSISCTGSGAAGAN